MEEVEAMFRRLIGKFLDRPLWLVKRNKGYSVFFTVEDSRVDDIIKRLRKTPVFWVRVRVNGTYQVGKRIRAYSYYKIYLSKEGFYSPFVGPTNAICELLESLAEMGLVERKYTDVELIMLLGEL